MRRTLFALAFAALPQVASAQNPISSITLRADGNTEQSTTIPVTNPDGTTGTQTTYTIRQPDGSTVELDKQGHITKVSLKENCSEGQSRVTNATYVCRLYKGELVQFKVLYLTYSCHAPDSNVYDMQRRFAISFQNTGVPCAETSYALDRADAERYGESLPEYKPKAAEKPPQPEHTTGGGTGERSDKHPRKAERKSTKRHRAARRESQPSETAHSTSGPAIELSIGGFGSGRRGGFERHETGTHGRKTD